MKLCIEIKCQSGKSYFWYTSDPKDTIEATIHSLMQWVNFEFGEAAVEFVITMR